MWLVAVSTGTAGRGEGMRGGGGEGKRTRPEGERFSWPVTPVPVLLSTLNSSSAGVMTASLGRFTPCFTCKDSLVTKSEVEECNHMRYIQACPL